MKLIRLQDMTPPVYTEESRDFQVLCRLYDTALNAVKFDIDSMKYITDTDECRVSTLQLLQTKLGFFTNLKFDDAALRYILKGFPLLIKNKGSKKGIEAAIDIFLKIFHIQSSIIVTTVNEGTIIHGTEVDDHSIIVELSAALSNTSILTELFKYIFPAGYGFYIYFYDNIEELETFNNENSLELLFISDNIESQLRSFDSEYDKYLAVDAHNRLVGAVPFAEIASIDAPVITTEGTYTPGDKSKFRGVVSDLNTITSPETGDVAVKEGKMYIYKTNWKAITFKGLVNKLPTTGSNYDLIGVSNKKVRVVYYNNQWIVPKYRGEYSDLGLVYLPETNDCVKCQGIYYLRDNSLSDTEAWVALTQRENYIITKVESISDVVNKEIFILDGTTYYLYESNAWRDFTNYTFVYKYLEENTQDE